MLLTRIIALSCLASLVVATSFANDSGTQQESVEVEIAHHANLIYTEYDDRKMHLDLFVPQYEAANKPAILVIHGGGWLKGDRTKFHSLAEALAKNGFVTAAVEYRLGGEAKFPAAIHDCNAATAWLRANAAEYGVDPERIGAVGGSAGGHLVGLMASAADVKQMHGDRANATLTQLQAAVVLAGPMELATGPVAEKSRKNPEQSNTNKWLGKTVDQAPELYELASPYRHSSAKTPPMLFMTGEFDLPERNLATRNKLREAGVPTEILVYGDGKHGCWNREPWQSLMVSDMAAFLAKHLAHDLTPFVTASREFPWGVAAFDPQGITLTLNANANESTISIPRLNTPVPKVEVVKGDSNAKLAIKPGIKDWAIGLPKDLPKTAAKIRLTTIETPHFTTVPSVVTQHDDRSITLPGHRAEIHGKLLRYEPQPHKNTIGYWANVEDWCAWKFYAEHRGTFDVVIMQGCGKGHGGSEVDVLLGKQSVTFIVEDTGHFQNFKERTIGTLTIDSPGVYQLEIRPKKKAAGAVMDVRQMRLQPRAQ